MQYIHAVQKVQQSLDAAFEVTIADRSFKINPCTARSIKKVGQHCVSTSGFTFKFSRFECQPCPNIFQTCREGQLTTSKLIKILNLILLKIFCFCANSRKVSWGSHLEKRHQRRPLNKSQQLIQNQWKLR